MSNPNLTDQYIDDTFDGILHLGGDPLPASGKQTIYDGTGQVSSLSIGLANAGATVSGTLSSSGLRVGPLLYPNTGGTTGALLYQSDPNTVGRISQLPSSYLTDLVPDPSGKYNISDLLNFTINSKGLVTKLTPNVDDGTSNFVRVASTYYLKIPKKVVSSDKNTVDIPSSPQYKTVSVSNVVPSTATAIIGYVELYTVVDSRAIAIAVTHDPDQSNGDFKAWSPISSGYSASSLFTGTQFVSLIDSTRKFYIANVSNVDGYSLITDTHNNGLFANIWILGYQQ